MTDLVSGPVRAPGLARRMAAFTYEGLLLFAVAVVTALVYSPLMQQHHALKHRGGLIAAVGLSFAAYFIYFWTRSGQTLPMKTWRIRLVRLDGMPLGYAQATLRFVLSFAWWVMPTLSALQLRQHGLGFGAVFTVGLLGIATYALLAKFLPGQQFLHDIVCRTQLVDHQPPTKKAAEE